jgi:GNAT superfamily N-acetyltransferase
VATPRYRVERLGRHHDRDASSCGEEPLDRYLRQRARQDDERNVAKVFVLADAETHRIAGYYTLSAVAVQLEGLPPEAQRRLPTYPAVPVVLLGRLATDRDYRGHGLGGVLLVDALGRAFDVGTRQIGATAVVVDALHERARSFCERHGFQRFSGDEYRLLLPMQTIAQLLDEHGR